MNDTTSKSFNPQKTVTPQVGTTRTQTVTDLVSAITDESPEQFRVRVMKAELNGHKWIEASDDIITTFNPDGLGEHSPYFTMGRGLKVYKANTKIAEDEKEKALAQKREVNGAFFEGRS